MGDRLAVRRRSESVIPRSLGVTFMAPNLRRPGRRSFPETSLTLVVVRTGRDGILAYVAAASCLLEGG